MRGDARLTIVPGDRPLVLVAPHGGRRDGVRRPWSDGHLRVNDLHTAALTAELAAHTGGAAVINAGHDRNDVDLNRISDTHDAAPWFLEALTSVLETVLARHPRATLLAVHGWNVVQPVVDLGLGCAPGDDPFIPAPGAAVGRAFAGAVLPRFVAACRARRIGATVGARYPARHRENLLQLFGPRYASDPRPLVRALATFAPRVDAVQLELGIALRWPGSWRSRLVEACLEVLPALLDPGSVPATAPRAAGSVEAPVTARRLQFTDARFCGLVALDGGRGGRLLLFPPEGGLFLFTGERIGLEPDGVAGKLRLEPDVDGTLSVQFSGPLLRFPDTTPFLDLEAGLARAELLDADVAIRFAPDHPAEGFGTVTGSVTVGGETHRIRGDGFATEEGTSAPWPRLRAALRLADGRGLVLTVGADGVPATGFVCRGGHRVAVASAQAVTGGGDSPLERVTFDLALSDGERLAIVTEAIHRLPVIRARGGAAMRFEFAACRIGPGPGASRVPAGWLEAGGL